MKFLVDAQLPRSLFWFLEQKGFDSKHTFFLPKKNKTSDIEILEICGSENRILIIKDDDFRYSFFSQNVPEKIVFVTTGNISNEKLLTLFEKCLELLIELLNSSRFIEFSAEEIIVHR